MLCLELRVQYGEKAVCRLLSTVNGCSTCTLRAHSKPSRSIVLKVLCTISINDLRATCLAAYFQHLVLATATCINWWTITKLSADTYDLMQGGRLSFNKLRLGRDLHHRNQSSCTSSPWPCPLCRPRPHTWDFDALSLALTSGWSSLVDDRACLCRRS